MKAHLEGDWHQPCVPVLTTALLQYGMGSATWLHARNVYQSIQSID